MVDSWTVISLLGVIYPSDVIDSHFFYRTPLAFADVVTPAGDISPSDDIYLAGVIYCRLKLIAFNYN